MIGWCANKSLLRVGETTCSKSVKVIIINFFQTFQNIKQIVCAFTSSVFSYSPRIHTLSLYKRLAGFVMAYSFTDSDAADAKPAMVPMADILNHVSENNANLEFGDEFLSMITTQPVEKVSYKKEPLYTGVSSRMGAKAS